MKKPRMTLRNVLHIGDGIYAGVDSGQSIVLVTGDVREPDNMIFFSPAELEALNQYAARTAWPEEDNDAEASEP